jgi:hypothetical protein
MPIITKSLRIVPSLMLADPKEVVLLVEEASIYKATFSMLLPFLSTLLQMSLAV